MSARARGANRRRGVAAIEMAIVLPLFCLVLFGSIDYGYWFMVDLAATSAVEQGTRAATTIAGPCPNGPAIAAGTTAISTYLGNAGLGGLARNVSTSCNMVGGNPEYRFNLIINFRQLTGYTPIAMPAAGAGFGSGYTSVSATATMRGN
jgi:hypothetical protein